jgi:hypothetical protein
MKPVPDLLRLLLLLVAGSGSLSGGERNEFGKSGRGGRHCSFSPESRSLNCSLPSLTALIGGGSRVSFLDAFPAAAAARTIHIRCEGWEEGETEVEGEREEVEGPSGGRPFSGLGGLERLELEQCRQVSFTENRFLLFVC